MMRAIVTTLFVVLLGQFVATVPATSSVAAGNTWTTSSGWSAAGVTASGVNCSALPCAAITIPSTVSGDLLYIQMFAGGRAIQAGSTSVGTIVAPANCTSSPLSCGYILSETGGQTSIQINLDNVISSAEFVIRSYHPSATTAVAETVPAANSTTCSTCSAPTATLTGTSDIVISAFDGGWYVCSVGSPFGNLFTDAGFGLSDNFNTSSGTGGVFVQGSSCPTPNSDVGTSTTVAFK